MYRPKAINELRTPVKLLIPETEKYNGVSTPVYPDDGDILFVNWKTYGGTESVRYGNRHNLVQTRYPSELPPAP